MENIIGRIKVKFLAIMLVLLYTTFSATSVFALAANEPHTLQTETYDEEKLRNSYVNYTGAKVYTVKKNKFCTLTIGDGKNVIFFLPGLGLTSPIIDLKPFATELSKKGFKVIIVEPLGTGMSDITSKKRSVGNITKELHELIKKMGYKKYSIMAHSIYGAYGLYYTNKYPKEVESFIALDASTPYQTDNKILSGAEKEELVSIKALIDSGEDISSEYYLSSIYDYSYTEEEKYLMREIFFNRKINCSALDECDKIEKNLSKCRDLKFPCKYLGFISEQNMIVYSAAFKATNTEELTEILTNALSSYVPSPTIRDLTKEDLLDSNGWAATHLKTYDTSNPANKTYVVPSNHYVHYSQEWHNIVDIIANWYQENVK